jgi:DNA-binding NtrC family response regulator
MKKPRLLLVDDVPSFLRETAGVLRDHFDPHIITNPKRALSRLKREPFDLVLTTLIMKEMDGFTLIRRIRGLGCELPIVLVTAHGKENTAVEALRLGAADYLEIPLEPRELILRVEQAVEKYRDSTLPAGFPLVSASPEMLEAMETAAKAAQSESRVLLTGETGTGKELVAGWIHHRSQRRNGPMIAVNCSAIPAELMESEFFGHEKGAFTGATATRAGRFDEAERGTLFLDEVGELDYGLQAKLLRVLQSGEFHRVGSSRPRKSDVRIIAATNRDLLAEVRAGRFRADLFYRLEVITIHLPPLRRRPKDIHLLTTHFIHEMTGKGYGPIRLSPSTLQRLEAHDWPGNARELEHVIERLSVLYPNETIEPRHLPETLRNAGTNSIKLSGETRKYREAREEFDRAYFQKILAESSGNLARAARLAGMERSHFFRKITSLGLRHSTSPGPAGL